MWQREEDPISVFMGVPTMYSYLLSAYDAMDNEGRARARQAAARLRLTVSGSAACPLPIMDRWEALSGTVEIR
jgi:malonyl-CoA/methylmalonyl-CoA synthetase